MPDYNITTGLPQVPAATADKEFNIVLPLYNAVNYLAQRLSVAAGLTGFTQAELSSLNQLGNIQSQNHRRVFAKAVGSSLSYGKIVNLYLSGGKIAAQYADATNNTKPAHGIVNQPQGIVNGEFGEVVVVEGYSMGIAGTTFGLYYYLSTNGDVQSTRPAAAGSIVQPCGFGLGSSGFYLHISSYFQQN